jgi:hypothetical protein
MMLAGNPMVNDTIVNRDMPVAPLLSKKAGSKFALYLLAIGPIVISRTLLILNAAPARVLPGLFAYQTLIVSRPRATSDFVPQNAYSVSSSK